MRKVEVRLKVIYLKKLIQKKHVETTIISKSLQNNLKVINITKSIKTRKKYKNIWQFFCLMSSSSKSQYKLLSISRFNLKNLVRKLSVCGVTIQNN